jgi:hypothetical protein
MHGAYNIKLEICFPQTAGQDMTDILWLMLLFDKMSFRWGITEQSEVKCSRFLYEGSCHKMMTV